MKLHKTIFCIFSVLLATGTYADSFTGKVVAITDGDTVQVMHNGKAEKIRLWGIDAPERNQAYGTKAKQFLSDKIFGQTVTVEVKDVDRYGRTVGLITSSTGENINALMVRQGYAWWYEYYAPKETKLGSYQVNAMERKLGLWNDSQPPVAPWDFRKSGRPSSARPQAQQRPVPQQTQQQTITVYLTKTGKKYHRSGCGSLYRSKIPTDLVIARQKYGPCGNCKPPR